MFRSFEVWGEKKLDKADCPPVKGGKTFEGVEVLREAPKSKTRNSVDRKESETITQL